MAASMYTFSVGSFTRALAQLAAILEKAAAHAEAKAIEPAALIGARLYPDMFPLGEQVRRAADGAVTAAAYLSGQEPPPRNETKETSFPELIARVQKALTALETFKSSQIDGSEERPVSMKTPRGEMNFSGGLSFLQSFALPNFYFHVTTAYAILRHNGLEIGKMDYLGKIT